MKYRTKKVLAMILATVLLFSTVDSAFAEGSLAGPAVMTESVAEQESVDTGIVINSETTTENQSSEETVVTLAEEKAEVPVEITGTELETAGPETIVSGETQAVVSGESSKETRVVIAGENSGETIIPENAGETIVPGNAEETVVPESAEETDGEAEVSEEAELLGAFTITYKSANSEMGSVSRKSETIYTSIGQISGSTAKPESGYKFLYWTMDDQSEPYSENATFKPTLRETHTYTAYFVETKERTVHFDMNGHGEKYKPADITVLAGETISTPSEPEIGHIESEKKLTGTDYYQFLGWDYDFDEPIESNITIEAQWQEVNHIEYKVAEHGTVEPSEETFALAEDPSGATAIPDEGYAVDRWEDSLKAKKSTDTKYVPTETPFVGGYLSPYTVYFTPIEYTYSLYMDVEAKDPYYADNYNIESADIALADVSGAVPEKDGYIFKGWTGTDVPEATTSVVIPQGSTGNREYYAKWEKAQDLVTVRFDLNGHGADGPDDVQVERGKKVTMPQTNPVDEQYVFAGWYKEPACENAWVFGEDTATENLTILYAKWNIKQSSVHFHSGHGTEPQMQLVDYGSTAATPSSPKIGDKVTERDYVIFEHTYQFEGWYTDEDCTAGNEYDFGTPVTADLDLYAKWREVFEVTFWADNKKYATEDVLDGDAVTKPEDPEKENYSFQYWTTLLDVLNPEPYDFSTPVTGNKTLVAYFKETEVTITYVAGEGGSVSLASESVAVTAKSVQGSEATPDEGYEFVNWTDVSGATVSSATVFKPQKTGDVYTEATYTANFKAKPTFTVSFDMQGHGTQVGDQEILKGGKANKPGTPEVGAIVEEENVKYVFDGWFTDDSFATAFDFDNTTIIGDTIIYAKWTAKQFAVTFNNKGHGEAPAKIWVASGSTATRPEKPQIGDVVEEEGWPTSDYYKFAGWYTDRGCSAGNEYSFTEPVSAGITLYAKWRERYTVSFMKSPLSLSVHETAYVYDGETATISQTNPEQEGFTFKFWYKTKLSELLDPEPYDFSKPVYADLILYPYFAENEVTISYVVSEGGGGTVAPEEETLKVLTDFAKGSLASPSEGYEFINWVYYDLFGEHVASTNAKFVPEREKEEGESLSKNVGRTYIANFAKKETIVTVSYDMQGHGTQVPSANVKQGDPVSEPDEPSAIGYEFDGWFTDTGFGTQWDFADPVTEDMTLVAKWIYKTVTVSFDMQGHGDIQPESQVIAFAGRATRPEFPEEGYISEEEGAYYQFDGWYMDETCLVKYPFATTPVVIDLTLYAKWTRLNTVTFDMGGHGEQPEMQLVRPLGFAATPEAPQKGDIISEKGLLITSYYRFDGWYLDTLGMLPFIARLEPILMDTIVYAKWTRVYRVTFDYDGHGERENYTVYAEFGKTVARPDPDPTDADYIFQGWKFLLSDWDFENDKIYLNTTLKADWQYLGDVYLTYNSSDESMGGVLPEYERIRARGDQPGGAVAIPIIGYEFVNWTNANGKVVGTEPAFVPESSWGRYSSMTYTANFRPIKTTITVDFDMNGHGEQVPGQEIPAGDFVERPAAPSVGDIVRERRLLSTSYYRFDGWFSDEALTTPFAFEEVHINEPLTVYAKWTRVYQVTFDYQDHGERENYSVYAEYETTIARPDPDPSDEDYTFLGWRYFASDWDFENDTVTGNMTLTASWIYKGNVYITYRPNDVEMGITIPATERLRAVIDTAKGSTASPSEGYTFVSWTDEDGNVVGIDETFVPQKKYGLYYQDATYTANFEGITCMVSFDTGSGEEPVAFKLVKYGEMYGNLPHPTRAGYDFLGWFDAEGNKVISTTTVPVWTDHTLTAKFEKEDVIKDDAGIKVGKIDDEGLSEAQKEILGDLWQQIADQEVSGILDMFDMNALKDNTEFLPDAEYLRVELDLTILAPQIDAETGKITVAYDATPYLFQVDHNGHVIASTKTRIDNSYIIPGKTLTFILNVPRTVTDKYAIVKHFAEDGSATTSKNKIQTDALGGKFVYVSASHFSRFEMTFTSQEDPQPIPPGPTPVYGGGGTSVKAGWKSLGNDQWNYMLSSGKKAIGWLQVDGLWYHFSNDGLMDFGWFLDTDGKWYYLSEEHNGYFGMMATGWHHDKDDRRDYFLDLKTGAMYTGIQTVDDKKRIFNDKGADAWYFGTDGRWHFAMDYSKIPLGALLK